MQQMPLPLQLEAGATFKNYVAEDNAAAVHFLAQLMQQNSELQAYLWSREPRGKSHLLQALCHAAASRGERASYLALGELQTAGPELLQGLEQLPLVCIDDVDCVVAQRGWAEALFHLINRCRSQGCRLVFAARLAPGALPQTLADLTSRLQWGPIFHLKPLTDRGLYRLVEQRAHDHGLTLNHDAIQFLLARLQRNPQHLVEVIKRLDQETLAQQRSKITIPFMKRVLSLY